MTIDSRKLLVGIHRLIKINIQKSRIKILSKLFFIIIIFYYSISFMPKTILSRVLLPFYYWSYHVPGKIASQLFLLGASSFTLFAKNVNIMRK